MRAECGYDFEEGGGLVKSLEVSSAVQMTLLNLLQQAYR